MRSISIAEWSGYRAEASVAIEPARLGATLFRLDVDEATETIFQVPSDTHLICVHLAGTIDWSATYDDRHYRRPCAPGTLCLARAGEQPHVVYRDAHARFVHFYLPTKLVEQYTGPEATNLNFVDPENQGDERIIALARETLRCMRAGPSPRLLFDALGLQLIGRLVERWSNVSSHAWTRDAPPRGGSHDWRLRRAIEYMEARIADDLGLEEVANAVGLTTAHLTILFRTGTGEPPHRWLMRRRFERACEMLAGPRVSVTEVAAACGFASSQHLSTVFRKRLGVSPTQYRREQLS